jgi:hypothetical protein
MLNKFKMLLLTCVCMSFQCFAFTFSKTGTVWAFDCNEGSLVRSFAKTSSGELGFFSWQSPTVQARMSIVRFFEAGNQIAYVVKNVDTNDVFSSRVSFAGGVWSILDAKKNDITIIENGLIIETGRKAPSFNQCPQTSTAYKMVFPSSSQTANSKSQNSQSNSSDPAPGNLGDAKFIWGLNIGFTGRCDEESGCLAYARKFPRDYANFINEIKNELAREQRARRECATAGDIDRCIRIKTGKE